MSTAENKELVRRYFDERWNHGHPDICDELLAPSLDIRERCASFRSAHPTASSSFHLHPQGDIYVCSK